jgi:hypothetical protein
MKERSEDVATTNILEDREEPESVRLLSLLLNTRILSSLLLIIANVFTCFFLYKFLMYHKKATVREIEREREQMNGWH